MLHLSILRSLICIAATSAFATGAAIKQNTPRPSNPSGTVVDAPAMSVPRAVHTMTALPNGLILIAGGFTEKNQANESAQLFNTKTNRYTSLPSMTTVRHSHTATLLPNGKVLIVGGYSAGSNTTTAAELFDPATNTFVSTGSLRAARAGHVAVLLKSGKVLIAGGLGPDWTFLSSAELYDPASGLFTPTGSMTEARESHVGVRLHDGRVLVVGGHRDRRPNIKLYTSAEVYDESAGAFVRVGDMQVRRHKHDGVVLQDGRVLITGGSDERDDKGAYSSTEIFDPKTNTFSVGPTMQLARYKHNGASVVLPNGTVLVAGGATQAETFDPKSNRFTLVTSQSRMAGQFSAVAAVGNIALITGGYGNGTGPRESAWLFRPE